MKKLSAKRKKWNDRKAKKTSGQKPRNRAKRSNTLPKERNGKKEIILREPVEAPTNLCLLENTQNCLKFLRDLRLEKNKSKINRRCFVEMNIENVEKIDFSTVCILTAIINDFSSKGIVFRTNFPRNVDCKKQIEESGLLDVLFDSKGQQFPRSTKSELLLIQKGATRLTECENRRISETVRKTLEHLTGERSHYPPLRNILLEICGNSLEWGGTKNKQWLLGIKYEETRVIFTITDVGQGILKTLKRKLGSRFFDKLNLRSSSDILMQAFKKQYRSRSKENNRNKGLPSIKNAFDQETIGDLIVVTNNVYLPFNPKIQEKILNHEEAFNGTLYRWVVTKESLQTKKA